MCISRQIQEKIGIENNFLYGITPQTKSSAIVNEKVSHSELTRMPSYLSGAPVIMMNKLVNRDKP